MKKQRMIQAAGLLFIATLGLVNPWSASEADAHQAAIPCGQPGYMTLINDDGHNATFHLPAGDVTVAHNTTLPVPAETGTYTVDWTDGFHQDVRPLPEGCGTVPTTTTTEPPPTTTTQPPELPFDGFGNYCHYEHGLDGSSAPFTQFAVVAQGPRGFELRINNGTIVSDSDLDGHISWGSQVDVAVPVATGYLNGVLLGVLPHVGPSLGCPSGIGVPPTTEGPTSPPTVPETTPVPADSEAPSLPSSPSTLSPTTLVASRTPSTSSLPATGTMVERLVAIGIFVLLVGGIAVVVTKMNDRDGGSTPL